jgi:hypothetical protein
MLLPAENKTGTQWQDGYPNPEILQKILKRPGFILVLGETIIGYCAILINDEPAYSY